MGTLSIVRKERNISQQALAEAVGVDRSMISKIEAGKKSPSLRIGIAIATFLNATPEELFESVLARHNA